MLLTDYSAPTRQRGPFDYGYCDLLHCTKKQPVAGFHDWIV